MNIYELLKLLDQLFNLEIRPYNFVIIIFSIFCTIFVLILFRIAIKPKNKNEINTFEKTKTRNIVHLFIILSMFTLTLFSLYFKNMELQYFAIVYSLIVALIMSRFCFNRLSIVLALLVTFLANILTAVNLGIEVGEQTSDTAMIMRDGRWEKSLKASYYDIANVHSIMKAILNIIIGINVPESLLTYLILTFINLIFIVLIIYLILVVIYKAKSWLIVPTLVVLGSNPGLDLLFSPPSISLSLSLLTILLILKSLSVEKIGRENVFISTLSFFVSTLAHGSGVVVIAFLLVMLIASKISFRSLRKYQTILLNLLLLFTVIFWIRNTLPQILRDGVFVNYLRDLTKFLTGAISEWRSVEWSAMEVPRVTTYAWVLMASLAIVPLLSAGIDKITGKHKQTLSMDCRYSALAITGAMFAGSGFIATFFSNSLGRVLFFPGLMLLGVSTPYSLKIFSKKRNTWIILCLLISLSVVLGIATPSKMPLYEPYKKLTIAWRGSDYVHSMYARDFVPFISNATLKMYVKSDDVMPISYFYLLFHGSLPPTRVIKHMPEKILYNIVFMANSENYVGVSVP